ncbi:MAG: hypothetical protein ABI882_19050, partial [Acidobacteriota bacterium]
MKPRLILGLSVLLSVFAGCNQPQATETKKEDAKMTDASSLEANIRRFAPTEITADASRLSEGDRRALDKIIDAAAYLDPLYRRQVWSGNDALLKKLEGDSSPEGISKLHYFRINVGPWSRLDKNEPFIEGVPREKPHGANFYPEDMTKEEFETWVNTLSEAERKKATGFFSVIRRDESRKLKIVPYSEEYREFLEPSARLLREAAALTTNQSLKNFLTKRADAYASDDYY